MKKIFILLLFIANFCSAQNSDQIKTLINGYVTPTLIGLGDVNNTSDVNKIVSDAQGAAINSVLATATGVYPVIASKTGVSGAALASTTLTFASGISLSNYIPVLVVYKYASGTLGIGVCKLKNSSGDLTATSALLNLTSTQEISIASAGVMVNSGNLSVLIIC